MRPVAQRNVFLSHVAVYTIANFSVAGIPFLLLPLLTRYLSPDAYGIVGMFSVVVALLSVLVGLNLHGAVMVRYFDSETFKIAPYVNTSLAILCLTTIGAALSITAAGDRIETFTGLSLPWQLLALVVAASQFVIQILLVLWQASKQPAKYAIFRLSQAAADGLLAILFVVILSWSWEGRLLGIVATSCMFMIMAAWIFFKSEWVGGGVKRSYAIDSLRFGVPLVPHALAGLALSMADRFILTNLLGLSATGVYIVAVQVGLVLQIASDALNKAFAPWLMEELSRQDGLRDIRIVKYTYAYFILIITVAIVAGLFAESIVNILAGEKYKAATEAARYMLVGNAFLGMYYMLANYVFYARRTELLSISTTVIGVTMAVATWYLVKNAGIVGAAQAFMIGQILMFLAAWWLAHYCRPMPWRLKSV